MIYIVMGETGEYLDHTDWPVLAFHNEEDAQAFVTKLDEWLRVNRLHMETENYHISMDYAQLNAIKHPLDPDMRVDYTGTRYYAMSVKEADDLS